MSGVLLGTWFAGYMQFSTSWILLGLFFYMAHQEYTRKNEIRLEYAKQAVRDERAAITNRLDELPSWVFFPDVERAEWLNKMIKQMWPFIGEYVQDLIKNTIEPSISNSLPKSLKPFRFERVDVGDTPPRIGGIKVYTDHVRRDEIILDMEIKYFLEQWTIHIYPVYFQFHKRFRNKSDHKRISGRYKESPSAWSAEMSFQSTNWQSSSDWWFKCFFHNSTSLFSLYYVFKCHIFFFIKTVDFDLTNVANLLDFPLLNDTIRSVLEDQLAYYLVNPNKYSISLGHGIDLNKLKYPVPQGVIRLHVYEARDLKKADFNLVGKGKSDPYCNIYVGAQKYKTKVINNTLNPQWDEYFEAIVEHKQGMFIDIDVMDQDPGEDDELGSKSIDVQMVANQGLMDTWLPLDEVETGMIHLRAQWVYLSKNPEDLDNTTMEYNSRGSKEEQLSTAMLMVYVDSAKNLIRQKKGMSEPSPQCKLSLGNKTYTGISRSRTSNPVFEESFNFFVLDSRQEALELSITDSAASGKLLGQMTFGLSSLLDAPHMTINRPFTLLDKYKKSLAKSCTVTLRLCLRILVSQKPEDWAVDNNEEVNSFEKIPNVSNNNIEEKSDAITKEVEIVDVPPNPLPESKCSVEDCEIRLRNRGNANTSNLGMIQLTLKYSQQREKLIVAVHKCMNLVGLDSNKLSDPYVRLFLVPDGSKVKTRVIKDNLNPNFDEKFEWSLKESEIYNRTLLVDVKNEVGMFSKSQTRMGQVCIPLSSIPNLFEAVTEWFYLLEPLESSPKSDKH
ncbi:DgyrCDS11099 [Dimorphilus gyrociliatus]|uniref:DgyrCDS11099 n=1 Tax=Dimorphilus gyrociliatus TaxID=2664684 RepID=A0A7I8W4U2_9ANNE|nr:DgyrCDS11099 [Dimorphilus gyrociliatus]